MDFKQHPFRCTQGRNKIPNAWQKRHRHPPWATWRQIKSSVNAVQPPETETVGRWNAISRRRHLIPTPEKTSTLVSPLSRFNVAVNPHRSLSSPPPPPKKKHSLTHSLTPSAPRLVGESSRTRIDFILVIVRPRGGCKCFVRRNGQINLHIKLYFIIYACVSTAVTARHLKKLYLQTGGIGGEGRGNIINVNGTHHRVRPPTRPSIALFTVEDLAASKRDCLDFEKAKIFDEAKKFQNFG